MAFIFQLVILIMSSMGVKNKVSLLPYIRYFL